VGRVVSLERERTRRLSMVIERQLREAGGRSVAVDAASVEDVARWRRAAIVAAHRMGQRASTYALAGQVRVELDLPVTAAEHGWAAQVAAGLLAPRP
jgi:hypothetical protein